MTRIENKPPYPFKKIAVAIAFSPRLEAILAESKNLQDIYDAQMLFIHVGEKNLQQEQYLKHLLHRFNLEKEENILLWEEGDPVEIILEKCKEHDIDLIVAGAMEKESLLKYFIGSIARKICRRAKCSVLMLREPSLKPKALNKIVVEGSDHLKTVHTIETAIYVAKRSGSNEVKIVQESDISKMALIRSENMGDKETKMQKEKLFKEENEKLEQILKCTDCGDLKVNIDRMDGKPGYVISNFAREQKADLLMLNSPDTKLNFLDRVFPHDIEYALANLPCDLLIVHSRVDE
jgi:nucleotide-binding universal stress UspA family protein